MKKTIIMTAVLLAVAITLNAQIPNSGFENWNRTGAYMEPEGWATANPYSRGSYYPVTRSTDHYPAGVGNYSVRLENNILFLTDFAGVGIIMPETLAAPSPVFPVSEHPNSLTGYYKFAPQNNDTMYIQMTLYNNGSDVARASFKTDVAAQNWTSFNVPFDNYTTADMGNMIIAAYNADGPQHLPHGNSVLHVDNLNYNTLISCETGPNENISLISSFPNPASGYITLNIDDVYRDGLKINIYNIRGELAVSETIKQNQRQIDIGDLSNGIYIVKIKSKNLYKTKKLIVQR
jgi:hypothetical protein